MSTENYFFGSATLDLTTSRMDIFERWRRQNLVFVAFTPTEGTPFPDLSALPVLFLSQTGVPGGITAMDVVFDDVVVLERGDD
jgi:hypothetical protein